jgi:type IV secretion system protein VirB5
MGLWSALSTKHTKNTQTARGEEEFDMTGLYEMCDPMNPYALGRREYDDRYERLAKNAASWRLAAFLMLLLLAVSVSVVLWMAQTVRVVPFIVQVDRHGYQIAVRAVAASDVTDDRVVMARLADFVTNMRSVYNDRTALVALLMKSYDSVEAASPAQGKLDSWFRENNPLTRGEIGVSVTMRSVLRAAPESNTLWQAEWSEKTYEQGRFKEERFYRGMFEVEFHSPTDIKDIMKNPLGIFVYDFHITEKLEK